MATYFYSAIDGKNSYIKGELNARSKKQALKKLEGDGFLVVSIKPRKNFLHKEVSIFSNVSRLDKIFLTRHLHTLLEAGIGLDQATKIAAEQATNKLLGRMLFDINEKIKRGQPLHVALAEHKKYFSEFFINLIKVGEKSGTLDEVLEHLLEQQEKDYELITKTRGALIYPSIIVSVAVGVAILMMTFVIPTITGLLTEYNVALPLPTKILIALSGFILHYGLISAAVLLILGFVLIRLVKTPKGRWQWEKILLSLPLFKKTVIEFNLARISRSLSALLKSGMQIDSALELAATVTHNSHYQKSIRDGANFVRKGIPFTEVMSGQQNLYPPIATRMLEVGEKTGKLDYMLTKLALFYEKAVLNTLSSLSSIIEPIMILFVGLMVAFIAVSILTPIWRFAQTI